MRVKYSLLNIGAGVSNQLVITLLSFVSRTVFISTLGAEYLGINGLFSNILSLLALAEAGIGQSIVYSLYKPVAENNITQINILMRLYKQAYLVIGIVVALLGLSLFPFLNDIVRDHHVQHIQIIYLIFLLNTIAPYLYVHKSSFLNVSQKNYVVTLIYSISSILSMCLKIAIIFYTKNYILYLCMDSFLTISNSIILAIIVNRKYPFLKLKTTNKLDNETKKKIIKNIKAIVLQNLGSYLILGTDNILISSFISLVAVGLYSNYKMLIDIFKNFLNQISNNTYHSFGNLLAQESKDKIYRVYKASNLLNFWLYSIAAIFLLITVQPFITRWLGKSYLLEFEVLSILTLTFLERGMRNAITTVKTTAGIFREDRYSTLIQAVLNLGLIFLGVKEWGMTGVFLGTLISNLLVPFWYTPYLVYKKVFQKPLISYFLHYFYFIIAGGISYSILYFVISPWGSDQGYFSLFAKGILAIIIPNIIYLVIFHKTKEFKYLFGIILTLKHKLLLNTSGKHGMNELKKGIIANEQQ